MLAQDFNKELEKFTGTEVVVVDINGTKYKGQLRGVSQQHLNVILMTETEKIIVRNVVSVTRKRQR